MHQRDHHARQQHLHRWHFGQIQPQFPGHLPVCHVRRSHTGQYIPRLQEEKAAIPPTTSSPIISNLRSKVKNNTDINKALATGTQPEEACETVIYSGGGFSNVFPLPDYQSAAVHNWFANYPPPYGAERFNNSQRTRAIPDLSVRSSPPTLLATTSSPPHTNFIPPRPTAQTTSSPSTATSLSSTAPPPPHPRPAPSSR